jgi:hypothetical protein
MPAYRTTNVMSVTPIKESKVTMGLDSFWSLTAAMAEG